MRPREAKRGSRARPMVALARWEGRQAGRALIRDAFGTLQGRLMLATSLAALPGLLQLVRTGGPLGESGITEAAGLGALLVGQAGLGLCLLVMVPVLTAKGLVLGRADDPMFSQGGFVPQAALLRAAGAVLGASGFLSAFFVLFHGRLGSAALFAAVFAQLTILGTVTAVATRRFLATSRVFDRARTLRSASVVPFLVAFPSFAYLPVWVYRQAPDRLGELGTLAATSVGDPSAALTWTALLVAGLLGSGWALSKWLEMSPAELCCPEGTTAPADGRWRIPLPRSFRARKSLVPLFVWKDLMVEWVRSPLAYLALQGLLVPAACVFGLGFGGPPGILAVSAALAAPTLGALGREGPAHALLRPVVSLRRLIGIKWAVGATFAWIHLPLYVLMLAVLARTDGLTVLGVVEIASLGALGCLLFCLLGTSLGVLLPDFERRSTLLPGASRSGRLAYALTTAPTIAFAAGALGPLPGMTA